MAPATTTAMGIKAYLSEKTCGERANAGKEGEGGMVHDKVADYVEVAAAEHKAWEA